MTGKHDKVHQPPQYNCKIDERGVKLHTNNQKSFAQGHLKKSMRVTICAISIPSCHDV